MSKKVVLSGMRPTGKLHLGHWVGALSNWVKLQKEYKCFFMVADWHALMSEYEKPSNIRENSLQIAKDWLSCGVDPQKSVLFLQSQVPQHLELAMIFSLLTPLGWLERCTTYKEQLRELKGRMLATYGFLGYPVLQAADIALYNADSVPVGMDQLPHLELARQIIRKFHKLYKKNIFKEPKPILTNTPKLIGIDNRKMSKSYNNFISLSDSKEQLRKKIFSMYTDPKRTRADVPGTVEGNPVFIYHDLFNPDRNQIQDLKKRYRVGRVGDVEVKEKLFKALDRFLEPIRQRRSLISDTEAKKILAKGAKEARAIAEATLARVKQAMNLQPFPTS